MTNNEIVLLHSMGIDPTQFRPSSSRGSWEEMYGQPPPPEPGVLWVPSPVVDGILFHLRSHGAEAPRALATVDFSSNQDRLNARHFEARWGWTRARVRSFLRAARQGRPAPASPRFGLVYAIGPSDGPVKIGFTSGTAEDRLRTLQTGSPVRLAVLMTVQAGSSVERALHRELRPHRIHGEWFERSAALAALARIRGNA